MIQLILQERIILSFGLKHQAIIIKGWGLKADGIKFQCKNRRKKCLVLELRKLKRLCFKCL